MFCNTQTILVVYCVINWGTTKSKSSNYETKTHNQHFYQLLDWAILAPCCCLICLVFPSLTEDQRCVDTRGHGVTVLLGTLPYVQESNLILIHFRFNSCWRLNSVGTDQINYPIHLLAAAGKPPNSGLWIIGRCSPSIRVSGTFINAVFCADQWGVKKEELTSLNVLQRLSCIITHLWK